MKLWFYSDPHFDHENIWSKFKRTCPACAGKGEDWRYDPQTQANIPWACPECFGLGEIPMRPFSSTQQMNETIIEAINSRVASSDHLYMLGDIAMKKSGLRWVKEIVCKHKRLVLGNHDIFDYKEYVDVGFEKLYGCRVIDNILFSHIPVHNYNLGRFTANVHGHTHTNGDMPPHLNKYTKKIQPYINISCEVTDYAPVDMDWINKQIKLYQPPKDA